MLSQNGYFADVIYKCISLNEKQQRFKVVPNGCIDNTIALVKLKTLSRSMIYWSSLLTHVYSSWRHWIECRGRITVYDRYKLCFVIVSSFENLFLKRNNYQWYVYQIQCVNLHHKCSIFIYKIMNYQLYIIPGLFIIFSACLGIALPYCLYLNRPCDRRDKAHSGGQSAISHHNPSDVISLCPLAIKDHVAIHQGLCRKVV